MNNLFIITGCEGYISEQIASLLNNQSEISCHNMRRDIIATPDNIDNLLTQHPIQSKKWSGIIQSMGAYEIQCKMIAERTKTPFRRAHICIPPQLRAFQLLQGWQQANETLQTLLEKLTRSERLKLYHFDYFYSLVKDVAHELKIENNEQNNLFLLAAALIVAFDTADLPAAGKIFTLDQILQDKHGIEALVNYLCKAEIILNNDIFISLENLKANLQASLPNWQQAFIDTILTLQPKTVYYPHIDQPISSFYPACMNGNHNKNNEPAKLISILLNSNRPAQLSAYFDNIEDTTDNPQEIEIVVNVDEDDLIMLSMLEQQARKRKFQLSYTTSPRPVQFCDLWQPINKLLKLADKQSYYLVNVSDEMLFATKGWDSILKKYIGYFPDHYFRLRLSRNKFRNYFDRWECSFAQDSIAIATRKWLSVANDWNPCFGPDSFQQLVAFYLAKEGEFSVQQLLREIPLIDIHLTGDIPFIGETNATSWKRINEHLNAMQVCQSHAMQQEARRRAVLIRANIYAKNNKLKNYQIKCDARARKIAVWSENLAKPHVIYSYKLSWLKITLVNQWRKLYFPNYFGEGIRSRKNILQSFARYLKMKHYPLEYLYQLKRRLASNA